MNLVALPTRSYYSTDRIRQQLLHVARMRGGRLSGYLLGEQTFWLTKVWRDVTRIDDNGDAVKGGAWLIELQANVDVASLLLQRDASRVAAAADAAMGVLEGGVAMAIQPGTLRAESPNSETGTEEARDRRAVIKQLRSDVARALEQYGVDLEVFRQFALDRWCVDDWGRSPEILAEAAALLKQVGPELLRLRMLLQGMNVRVDRHAAYAGLRYRCDCWQLQPELVARAIREAEEHARTPDAFATLVERELEAS